MTRRTTGGGDRCPPIWPTSPPKSALAQRDEEDRPEQPPYGGRGGETKQADLGEFGPRRGLCRAVDHPAASRENLARVDWEKPGNRARENAENGPASSIKTDHGMETDQYRLVDSKNWSWSFQRPRLPQVCGSPLRTSLHSLRGRTRQGTRPPTQAAQWGFAGNAWPGLPGLGSG
jgi:hypothetical protein